MKVIVIESSWIFIYFDHLSTKKKHLEVPKAITKVCFVVFLNKETEN